MTTLPPAAATNYSSDESAVLAEIEKQQQSRSSWLSAIVLLVCSLMLFVVASKKDYSLKDLCILLGVLFFHEMGHYVAMRVFGYRNVRMFFIPFFGAAVSGQHYNVAGWKKVVVSFMGPLPGIIVAIPLGAAGLYMHHSILVDVAVLSLVLNGFNLLPVLPLDGGHVLHTLLFSRHHILDVVFRVVAIAALVAIALSFKSFFLLFIIAPAAISLPLTYKVAKVTTELRRSGFQPVSVDSSSIAPDSARTIIAKLRAASSIALDNRVVAKQTLEVFETLNAKPPGIGLSVLLGLVHAGAIVAVLVSVAVLMAVPRLNKMRPEVSFGDALAPITLEQVATRQADLAMPGTPDTQTTVVATFDDAAKARQAYEGMPKDEFKAARITLFGQTVLVSGAKADQHLIKTAEAYLKDKARKVSIADKTNQIITSFWCQIPDEHEKQNVIRELEAYFAVARFNAIAPWDPRFNDNAAQKDQWLRARETFSYIQDVENVMLADRQYSSLRIKMSKARQNHDQVKADELQAELTKFMKTRIDAALQALQAEPATKTDHELLAEYAKLPLWDRYDGEGIENAATHEERIKMLAPRFGLAAMTADHTLAPESLRYHTPNGYAGESHNKIIIEYLQFADIHQGPLALAKWLQDHGATNMQYRISYADAD